VKRPDLGQGAVDSAKVGDGTLAGIDLLDGSVAGIDLLDGTVGTEDVTDASLTGADVASSGLTGSDIATGSLSSGDMGDETLTTVDVKDLGLTGDDLATDTLYWRHINESNLIYESTGCRVGLTRSYARIKGSDAMPTSFTTSTTFVDRIHTCATSSNIVRVRRVGTGHYEVIFEDDFSFLAFATPHGGDEDTDNTISVEKLDGYTFKVVLRDQSGSLDDGWFQMMTM
jgi:hypothetical protein